MSHGSLYCMWFVNSLPVVFIWICISFCTFILNLDSITLYVHIYMGFVRVYTQIPTVMHVYLLKTSLVLISKLNKKGSFV